MNKWIQGWLDGWEWMNVQLKEWTNKQLMNGWIEDIEINDWRDKWVNEWMNEWMNEWINEWINEWMNEE